MSKSAKNSQFWKLEACGQTVLPDRPVLIGQKLVENEIFKNSNATFWVIFKYEKTVKKSVWETNFRSCCWWEKLQNVSQHENALGYDNIADMNFCQAGKEFCWSGCRLIRELLAVAERSEKWGKVEAQSFVLLHSVNSNFLAKIESLIQGSADNFKLWNTNWYLYRP